MRILMMNKFLYPRAGAETYMINVMQALRQKGHKVALFGMEHSDIPPCDGLYTVSPLELGGKHSIALELMRRVGGGHQNTLLQAIREFRPDLIHAHNIYHQLSPSLLRAVPQDIPVVMTVHDYKPICPNYSLFVNNEPCTRCLKGSFLPCIENRCLKNSRTYSALAALSSEYQKRMGTYTQTIKLLIAPSRFMKNLLVEGGIPEEHIKVLYNFVQEGNFSPIQNSGIAPRLFYFGRLSKEKGIDTLIEAYAKLAPPRPTLVIAGTGPIETQLKEQAKKHNLEEIIWLGFISQERIQNELSASTASIVPSLWYENCSMAILESLAAGRGVIASSNGGNPELIQDGNNGRLFRAGDVEGLLKILQEYQNHPQLSIEWGNIAREAYLNRFTEDNHLEALLDLYRSVIPITAQGIPAKKI